jgi:glycosyltransferase involved in cell wall biosynthesis
VAAKVSQAYRDLLEITPRRRARRRARIAYVSPLPPQRSGIADYSFRLLPRLAEHVDIDVFVDQPDRCQAPDGLTLHKTSALHVADAAIGGYDNVVYCLGNSAFHVDALLALRRRPGIVIAHDVRLAWLYAALCETRPEVERRSLHALVSTMYTDAVAEAVLPGGTLDPWQLERMGVFMAKEAIGLSERFLVHSAHAAQVARLEASGLEERIDVIPFGSPAALTRERVPSDALVATFGIVSAAKQCEKLVSAFATVLGAHPDARLAFVGPVVDDMRASILAISEQHGFGERVVLTDEVEDAEFTRWLGRTAVAVQLRQLSNGECSASVSECLAAGIPTLVTAFGAGRELPDNCVAKVEREVTPARLGTEISALLSDEPRRARLAREGAAFARRHGFGLVAERVAAELV